MKRMQLVAARARKHWTLEVAAEQLGVVVGTLSRWENGQAMPYAYNIERICEVYGQSAAELGLEPTQWNGETGYSVSTLMESSLVDMHTNVTARMFALVATSRRVTPQGLQRLHAEMTLVIHECDQMNSTNQNYQITRREVLASLASLPVMALGLTTSAAVLEHPIEDILRQCSAGLTACGYLSKGSFDDMSLAFSALSAYLPTLKAIVKDSSQHRKAAAYLTAQCFYQRAILSIHRAGSQQALSDMQQAAKYSQESSEIPLQITILGGLAWLYSLRTQTVQAAEAALQSRYFLEQATLPISSRIQSAAYAKIARCLAQDGQGEEGLAVLQRAYDIFDPSESYTIDPDNGWEYHLRQGGLAHYYLEDYEQALATFAQIIDPETLTPKVPTPSERARIETLNYQTLASLKLPQARKDKALSIHLWKAAIEGARTLQSEQRFSEALFSYELMRAIWAGDADVLELRDLTRHW